MSLVEYKIKGQVAVITWNSGENRFNPDFLNAHITAMAKIEETSDARVIVINSAHEKIWCNGIDLDYLVPLAMAGDKPPLVKFFFLLNDFFKSLLLSPMITVACINGHAFAGGAMAACACDYRFMRSDRGFLCVPEVDLGMRFLPGMMALLKKAVPRHIITDMVLGGTRLTAEQCQSIGIVEKACHLDNLMDEAKAFAQTKIKERKVVAAIKRDLNSDVIYMMDTQDPSVIHAGGWNV